VSQLVAVSAVFLNQVCVGGIALPVHIDASDAAAQLCTRSCVAIDINAPSASHFCAAYTTPVAP
jgi:hypothetical protein